MNYPFGYVYSYHTVTTRKAQLRKKEDSSQKREKVKRIRLIASSPTPGVEKYPPC